MPRFHEKYGRGYDLDRESPFLEVDGVRYHLGSAGSMIWGCIVCGEEHFRSAQHVRIDQPESCFKGHGPMELMRSDEMDTKWTKVLEANGIRPTTVDERRALRLEDEAKRPWDWQFGNQTEADFPLGFAKASDAENAA